MTDIIFNQLKELHIAAFGEEGGYFDYFFQNVIEKSDVQYIIEDNRVVSALYLLRRSIILDASEIPAVFISGVGTLPDYRGRGFAGKNLTRTLDSLSAEGVPMALLVPSDARFYHRFGFMSVSHTVPYEATERYQKRAVTLADAELLAELHSRRPFRLARSASDFAHRINEFEICGAQGYILSGEGRDVGYLFGTQADWECMVEGEPETAPYGMARVCSRDAARKYFGSHNVAEIFGSKSFFMTDRY